MRKLAPLFITTSVLALAAGNVLANDTMGSTDKNGSPTVSDNTQNPNKLSYGDKSNTAQGTNAKMEDQPTIGTAAKDKPMSADTTDQPAKPAKAKKAKVAHSKLNKDTTAKDSTVTDTPTEQPVKNPPLSATKGDAANSTTGKSAGGQ
jgi:hypothetical protein